MESIDYKEENKKIENPSRAIIHTKTIRAGNRTYFFDVKSTRNNEYFLTITESKKKYDDSGNFYYEKHKVFLYPEDFEKFTESLGEVIGYIHETQPEIQRGENEVSPEAKTGTEPQSDQKEQEQEEVAVDVAPEATGKNFSNVDFEDI